MTTRTTVRATVEPVAPHVVAKQPTYADRVPLDPITVTLIIVTWNGRQHLERHLPSVLAAAERSAHRCEVLVVDNGSADGTVAWLHAQHPDVRVLALAQNHGFGGGNNRGALAARGRRLVFLNNDVRVAPDCLDPLLEPLEAPDVFAVGAVLETPRGVRKETGLTRLRFHRGLFCAEHRREVYRVPVPALYPSGAACAVDREPFLQLGGFDELFAPFYWEDTDLGYRAWQRGWRVLWQPRSVVYHDHRGTIGQRSPRFIACVIARNRWLFAWKNLRDPALWRQHLLWLPLRLAADAARGRWEALAGFLWALTRLPGLRLARERERFWIQRSDAQTLRLSADPLAHQAAHPADAARRPGERLKLLWVCPYLPREGIHAGGQRMFALIRELSRRHEVWVISCATSDEEPAVAALRDVCHHLDVVWRTYPWRRDPLSRLPAMVQEFCHPPLAALVRQRLLEERFDVAQFEYLLMAQYAPATYRGALVLTEHQVHGFARWRDLRSHLFGWPQKLQILGSALKGIAYELPTCARFDGVIALTPEDAALLRPSLPRTPLAVLPMGVDSQRFRREEVAPVASDLLFVGYYQHYPNVDAVLWCARTIWPLIRRARPQTTWTIVGCDPPPAIQALARQEGVRVTGRVEDLRPYLAGCGVFLMPIRLGGGMRGKLLEAWAMECAVVSTRIGCEGSQAAEGAALIADRPAAFAQAVLALLADPDRRRSLGRAGRRAVELQFDWRAIARQHESFYHRVLQRTEEAQRHHGTLVETPGALVGHPHG